MIALARLKDMLRRKPRPPPRDVEALVRPLAAPALRLVSTAETTGSYLGGEPPLADGEQWPEGDRAPLAFLACLDLAAVAATSVAPWLPRAGRLLFFYDIERTPSGHHPRDRSGWSVRHSPAPLAYEPAAAPPPRGAPLPRVDLGLERIATLPPLERPEMLALRLSDLEIAALQRRSAGVEAATPAHQVAGFAAPIEDSELELTCQLVSRGLNCRDGGGYNDRRALALCAGVEDWRLLLQVDGAPGSPVGDAARLFFYVREQDARSGCFDDVWVLRQRG